MAPKAKPVDKARQEAKEKIASDKTFGLKNKNKSKNVQKYIKQISQTATGQSSKQDREERKEKAAQEASDKKSALMASLFNLQTDKKGKAYDPVAKKAAALAEEEALAAGKKVKEEIKKSIIEGVANTIRLTNPKTGIRMSELGGHPIIGALKDKHADTFKTIQLLLFIKVHDKIFWLDDRESSNPIIRCQEDVDEEEGPDERSIEEIIQERMRALTGPGTPITEETFKAWKKKKEDERLSKVEEDRKNLAKKTGGKGLTAMSGKDLFTYDASLFVDDDGAVSDGAYDEREDVLEDRESDDEDSDGDDGADGEAAEVAGRAKAKSGAAGSQEAAADVAINKDLFLQEADDLDDLDDLDDDDEEEDADAQVASMFD
jgi:hypothetical protein